MKMVKTTSILCIVSILAACSAITANAALSISEQEYFSTEGVNIFAFNSPPGGLFFDAKTSGIEVIHHGERTMTNGDVRLLATPEQWDGMGQFVSREIDTATNTITTKLAYPEHDFGYKIAATALGDSVIIRVILDRQLPPALVGKAGFNMEFLPSVYWNKSFIADGVVGQFPRSSSNAVGMTMNKHGQTEPSPLAIGKTLVLSPEDPAHRITLSVGKDTNPLMLFDGRAKAQNGWYVVRSLIPAGKIGTALQLSLNAHAIEGWVRKPVVGFSQVGYQTNQRKQAVIELDLNDNSKRKISLQRILPTGDIKTEFTQKPEVWGTYLRYRYATFDFTSVNAPGLYRLQYGDQITPAFPIADNVFGGTWQPTLDVFLPVQMDHMVVKDAYRTWHGLSHMDDAVQAPANYEHFDLYAHDAKVDTRYQAFEHISGLNIGGWYDAGDFDIRTQSQYHTVQGLVDAYEEFNIERDNTTVDQARHFVQINRPDGGNDIVQQIEHGTLALIAQHRSIGHAIPGIVAGRLYQYPHLGDGATKTDGMIYSKKMDPHAEQRQVGKMYQPSTVDPTPTEDVMPDDGNYSGKFDDRWAFTSNTTALNYGSAAALAAASRALTGFNDALAKECLETAKRVWVYEAGRTPNTYRFGNTTGGHLVDEKLKAAVELLVTTKDTQYQLVIIELLPEIKGRFSGDNIGILVKALPMMDDKYRDTLEIMARAHRESITDIERDNPYGVPITRRGWAGNNAIMNFGISNYWLHKAFPDIVEKELVYRSLAYLYGTHPDSNYSFVSGVGAESQTNAYGGNRADFSFIAGGVVPGVLVLAPDYPENKSDWPFFWGQNEYVIPMASRYLFLTHAAQAVLK